MHPEAIESKTRNVLEKIRLIGITKQFYLAGGTALALYLGHRESIDLDWFSDQSFSNDDLKKELSTQGFFELDREDKDTILGILDRVRISFFRYNYGLINPPVDFEGTKIASEQDIAAMKIDAISSRGSKKDFVDIYFLLQKYSLGELINFFERKYGGIKFNRLHILKSLVYFDDAEKQPEPIMLKEFDWRKAKATIEIAVKKYLE